MGLSCGSGVFVGDCRVVLGSLCGTVLWFWGLCMELFCGLCVELSCSSVVFCGTVLCSGVVVWNCPMFYSLCVELSYGSRVFV